MQSEVFVSYSKQDEAQVLPIVQRLRAEGISVWYDHGSIDGGSLWPDKIVEGINQCKVLLLMASRSSVASSNVYKEVSLAATEEKSFLPLHLHPVTLPNKLRYHLADVQFIKLYDQDKEQNYKDILRALSRLGVKTAAARHAKSSRTLDNPYDFAMIATREMFKGREAEIDQLLNAIESGTHVSVFGLQRIGKTSLVEEALVERIDRRSILRDNTIFVKVDLQRLGGEDVTYKDIFQAIIESVARTSKAASGAGDIELAVNYFLSDPQRYQRGRKAPLLTDCEAVMEKIAAMVPQRIVLFLDEFSELCRVTQRNEELLAKNAARTRNLHPYEMLVDVALMRWFSSLLKNRTLNGKIQFIFAIRPFVAEFDSDKDLQILKLTRPVCLYYLDEPSARALMVEPLDGLIDYEDGAVDYLYALTAGHPYLIQFFLKEMVDTLRREARRTVLLSDIKDLEDRMISEGPAYDAQFEVLDSDYSIEEVLNRKRATLGRMTLALIATQGEQRLDRWVPEKGIVRELDGQGSAGEEVFSILSQLERAKIITEEEIDGDLCFRISVPLLHKRYVEQNMYVRYLRRGTR